jgi:hypothetical protein
MATIRRQSWTVILVVALVLFALAMLFSGLLVWYIALLFVLVAMGGGALLYRTLGPPTR